jgi:hypothetical protein
MLGPTALGGNKRSEWAGDRKRVKRSEEREVRVAAQSIFHGISRLLNNPATPLSVTYLLNLNHQSRSIKPLPHPLHSLLVSLPSYSLLHPLLFSHSSSLSLLFFPSTLPPMA